MTEPVTVATAALQYLFARHIVEMRDSQAELIRAQMQMHQESLEIQTQLLERSEPLIRALEALELPTRITMPSQAGL